MNKGFHRLTHVSVFGYRSTLVPASAPLERRAQTSVLREGTRRVRDELLAVNPQVEWLQRDSQGRCQTVFCFGLEEQRHMYGTL